MTKKRCWSLLAYSVVLFGGVLGGALVSGRLAEQRWEQQMNSNHFTVDHVQRATDKPFEDVAKAFERQFGRFDPDVRRKRPQKSETPRRPGPGSRRWSGRADSCCSARKTTGPAGLAGQKRKAIQYIVGNPLFALQMTQHDIRASLYAPLRVLYENEEGKTCVEYDSPSSLFGQFGNDRISPTAAMLDRKLEALVVAAIE